MNTVYKRRQKLLCELLTEKGFCVTPSRGTFYLYVKAPTGMADGTTFATAEDVMGEDVKELAKITEPEEYLIDDSMIIKPLPLEEAKKVELLKGPNIKFLPIPEPPQQDLCVPVSLKTLDNV